MRIYTREYAYLCPCRLHACIAVMALPVCPNSYFYSAVRADPNRSARKTRTSTWFGTFFCGLFKLTQQPSRISRNNINPHPNPARRGSIHCHATSFFLRTADMPTKPNLALLLVTFSNQHSKKMRGGEQGASTALSTSTPLRIITLHQPTCFDSDDSSSIVRTSSI